MYEVGLLDSIRKGGMVRSIKCECKLASIEIRHFYKGIIPQLNPRPGFENKVEDFNVPVGEKGIVGKSVIGCT